MIEFLAPHLAFASDPTAWVALLTLIVLEVVLGIDNLIFISILTNKLPKEQQVRARRLGIGGQVSPDDDPSFYLFSLTERMFADFGAAAGAKQIVDSLR